MPKTLKLVLIAAVCVMTAIALAVPVIPSLAQEGGRNLLVDGDFEAPPTWPMQDGIGEVSCARLARLVPGRAA